MKPRILFLDDEPLALEGLQRMLRGMRAELEMIFVSDASEALQRVSQVPIDVVVSDMLMPRMDGAQFLSEVRASSPQTARLVLSGHADRTLIIQSLKSAHQYLSKPCHADVLKNSLSQLSKLPSALANDGIRQVVSRMTSLPSDPRLSLALSEKLKNSETELAEIVSIISRDAGMTAKILQWVNAGFFGARRTIAAPAEGVSCLGIENLKEIVLADGFFSSAESEAVTGALVNDLWKHSVDTAIAAASIAKVEGLDQTAIDAAYTGGLLHDVGKFVLVSDFPDRYSLAVQMAQKREIEIGTVEKELFGASHTEIGGYLLRLWGLPEALVDIAFFHHDPRSKPAASFNALTAVHIADALVHERQNRNDVGRTGIDLKLLNEIGSEDRLNRWRETVLEPSSIAV